MQFQKFWKSNSYARHEYLFSGTKITFWSENLELLIRSQQIFISSFGTAVRISMKLVSIPQKHEKVELYRCILPSVYLFICLQKLLSWLLYILGKVEDMYVSHSSHVFGII